MPARMHPMTRPMAGKKTLALAMSSGLKSERGGAGMRVRCCRATMNPRGIMAGATRRSHGRGGRPRRGRGASPIALPASDASARDGRLGERHHFVVELAREPHKGKRQRRARCFAEPQVEVEKRPRLERLEHELM